MLSNRQVIARRAPRRSRRVAARVVASAAIAVGVTAFLPGISSAAQAPVNLGTADSFAVLAGQGITNANATTIVGDVGTFPNPAETGFTSVALTGTNHGGDAVTAGAKDDLVTAYNQAAGAGPPTSVAVELAGTTLKPGVYSGATLEITGTLTLDTEGDPNAVFIFQTGSTLITAPGSSVTVLNGGVACNVFWKVPSSATLGTNSHLIGTVLASTAIAAQSGATVEGRLLAQTASVTLDHNTITNAGCTNATSTTRGHGGSTTTTPGETTTVPGETTTVPGDTTPTTTPGGPTDTTTPAGGTSDQPPGGTPGSPTASPGTPGVPTPGQSTPPTVNRPPLARTGYDSPLPLMGSGLVAAGVIVLGLSKERRRQATG
jgi:hypothetical protein